MKKFVTLALVFALLVTASMTVATPAANAQGAGLVSSLINRMERNRRDMRSLRSGIWMQKYNAQVRDSDNYVGNVIYVPGAGRDSSVRVDWQKPQKETLAVKDGKYVLFRQRLNMAYEGNANSNRNKVSGVLGFGLNVSGAQLRNNFEPLQLLGEGTLEAGGPHVTWIKLVPKGNAGYKHAEIWVETATGMPLQTKVIEKNGDSTTVRLLNPQRNARVSADEFNLQLPSDVKRIRG